MLLKPKLNQGFLHEAKRKFSKKQKMCGLLALVSIAFVAISEVRITRRLAGYFEGVYEGSLNLGGGNCLYQDPIFDFQYNEQ